MELEDTKLMNDLIDIYGELLTKNQLNVLEMYYMDDLSLSEIGENLNITRSAVHDSLKKGISILKDYEEKLKMLEKENKKRELINKIDNLTKEEIKIELEKI